MIGQVIKKLSAGVTALKGTPFFPNVARQVTRDTFAVYNISDREPMTSKNGVTSLDTFTFNITVYSADFAKLDDVATLTGIGFDGTTGDIDILSSTGQTVTKKIHSLIMIDQSDSFDLEGEIHAREMTFKMILER